jgi:hypothetical protein
MLDITRKKYSGEMKFTVTRAFTHKTVAELREELLRVKNIVDYWEEKSNKRAFGEIKLTVFPLKNGEKYIRVLAG